MKRLTPLILASLAVIAFGFNASSMAEGATSKAVTQAQISKLQSQVNALRGDLEQAENTIGDLQEQMRNSVLGEVTFSRHVWLTPAGLSTGCGEGAVYISTYNLPGTNAGFTGCVADILVKPIPQP